MSVSDPFEMPITGYVPVAEPIRLNEGSASETVVTVRNEAGAVVPLDDAETITLRGKQAFWEDELLFEVEGSVIGDGLDGRVGFTIPALDVAGVIVAELDVEDAEGRVTMRMPLHVIVTRSLRNTRMGPPTPGELRLVLRDVCSESNYTIEAREFSEEEMAMALRMPVMYWNETAPSLPGHLYDATNFPYRYYYLRAAAAILLEIAAQHELREHIPMQTPGAAIDHKGKADAYLNRYRELWAEFRNEVRRAKAEINMLSGFGTIGSPY